MNMGSSKAFDFDAEYGLKYDQFIRQIIPGYDSYFPLCISLLSEQMGPDGSLLVAGCGTGTELLEFASVRPDWSLIGVDLSDQMIKIAERKLQGVSASNTVKLLVGDVTKVVLDRPLNAVTCNLVMHFLRGQDAKLQFLKSLKSNLAPGGTLILMDACWEKSAAFSRMMRAWWDYAKNRGLLTDRWFAFREEFESSLHPLTRDEEVKLIEQAGFGSVCPFWSSLHHQAFVAVNSG